MRMILASTIGGPMVLTLRLIGVWPDSSCKFLQRVAWTMTMVTSQLFQYWYLFTHIGSDTLEDLMNSMSLCLSNSLLFLKMSILWINGRIFYNMLTTMVEDWDECTTALKTRMMTNKAVLSRRFSKYTIGVYTGCLVFFWTSGILSQRSAELSVETGRQLIVRMELPFEYNASPLFEIVQIVQFLLQFTCALLAGMLNALIVTLILHIAGQIDIMCYELMEIPAVADKRDLSRIVALRAVVNRHQRIIAFADSVEDVFCYMALVQFFSNTAVICFLGFVIVTLLGTDEGNVVLVKVIPYYAVVNLEAFVICFTGEYLNSKSKSITQAAYDSLWYELEPTESRLLLLLLVKSQRQLSITIGKFMDLSLESFTGILKTSASYMSVLHAMY
ncbi:odorant receptor 4-like [Pseudomyrmex gracilis]|uniref:odorant receptor 4-like n=1 Tax=Pseudomyrmex gracilis TaxID=219809 RepID=UPI00099555C7|nr:odorant receptor 4-like [Pseudomyrmex gracilis]